MSEKKYLYRLELAGLIDMICEEDVGIICYSIRKIIKMSPHNRFFSYFSLIQHYCEIRPSLIPKYVETTEKVFGTHEKENLPIIRSNFRVVFSVMRVSKEFVNFIGILMNGNFFSDQEKGSLYRKLLNLFSLDYSSYFNALKATTLFLSASETIKALNSLIYDNSFCLVRNVLSNFTHKEKEYTIKEFNNHVNGEKSVNKLYSALLNDSVEDMKANMTDRYHCSIYEVSKVLQFMPSILSAALFYKAHKCASYLLENGADANQEDSLDRSAHFFAGASGDCFLIEKRKPDLPKMEEFITAAIQFRHNEIVMKLIDSYPNLHYMHLACKFNNFILLDTLIKKNFKLAYEKDNFFDLPLHCAARMGSSECLVLLSVLPNFSHNVNNYSNVAPDILAMNYCRLDFLILMWFEMGHAPREILSRSFQNPSEREKIISDLYTYTKNVDKKFNWKPVFP